MLAAESVVIQDLSDHLAFIHVPIQMSAIWKAGGKFGHGIPQGIMFRLYVKAKPTGLPIVPRARSIIVEHALEAIGKIDRLIPS